MAEERARITASLEGATEVVADARRMGAALKEAGDQAASGSTQSGQALKGLDKALRSGIGSALEMASSMLSLGRSFLGLDFNVQQSMERAKRFEEVSARLGQTAQVSGQKLMTGFAGLESQLLVGAPELAGFAEKLGRITYDPKSAVEALSGLGQEALATGRSLQEELDVGRMLREGLGVTGEVTQELARLRSMAEQVGSVGGHLAFKDTLVALTPLLAEVSTQAEGSRQKLEALVAVLGKGLSPQKATQAIGATLGMLKSRALDIERVTGSKVIDDQGDLIDPLHTLTQIQAMTRRRFGKNQAAARRALMADFGAEVGLLLGRTDLTEVSRVAQVGASPHTQQEAEAYKQTEAGRRIQQEIRQEQQKRELGGALLGTKDALLSSPKAIAVMGDVSKLASHAEKLRRRKENTQKRWLDGSGLQSTESLQQEMQDIVQKYKSPAAEGDEEGKERRAIFFGMLKRNREQAREASLRHQRGQAGFLEKEYSLWSDDPARDRAKAYEQVEALFGVAPGAPAGVSLSAAHPGQGQEAVWSRAGEALVQAFSDKLRTTEVVLRVRDVNEMRGNPG